MFAKKFFYAAFITLIILLAGELFLRYYVGFGDAVLIKEDPDFEYIAQPNQNRNRFTKRIVYNEYSMRNETLKENCLRILGFGDSVINGGSLTDQDSLATTLLSQALSNSLDTCVQVLNISAGSWGPDNAAAYLEKYGDFGARAIVLVVSSHDAYDNMTFEPIVGINSSFPNQQYSLAYWELIDRYILPKVFNKASTGNSLGINKNGKIFNTGFQKLAKYANQKDLPFFIYLHPEQQEAKAGNYNEQGQKIIEFAKGNDIPIIMATNFIINERHYRDNIHLNELGQKTMYKLIFSEIKHALIKGD